MSETSSDRNSNENKKLSNVKRPVRRSKIVYVQKSLEEERPKLTEKQREGFKEQLGERAEPRESAGWDTHPLGKDGIPAEGLRYQVFDEMRSRNYKGRNAVARMFGVSGGFVTKWTKILRAAFETGAGVKNACKALPTRPPGAIASPVTDRVKDTVLAVREQLRFLGPEKMKVMFKIEASASVICRIIRRSGFQREHEPYKRRKYVRFEMPFPLHTVQTDYKEWARGVYSIWVLDDRSRMILGHRVVAEPTAEVVKELMDEVVSKYGRPIRLLTDHGTQFTTMHKGGEHVFEKWLSENKIKHVMGRVNHPQTQGKIERTHGSAKAEMEGLYGKMPENIEEYRGAIDLWVYYYNRMRAHSSLDLETPVEVFNRERIGIGDPRWIEAIKSVFPEGSRVC